MDSTEPAVKQRESQRRYKEAHLTEYLERHREQERRYRADHPEKYREARRRYRETHSNEIRQGNRVYRETHREIRQESARRWREAHREERAEAGRKWREEHRDHCQEHARQYHATHLEDGRLKSERRRTRKRSAPGSYDTRDIGIMLRNQKGRCWWCGKAMEDKYTIDHRIPLVRGGSNEPTNLILACASCNKSKGMKVPSEFAGRLL
jgi:5-methylcytosine-specific restriction endonuclease McrA